MKVAVMWASRKLVWAAALLLIVLLWHSLDRAPSTAPTLLSPQPASPSGEPMAPRAQTEPRSPGIEPAAGFGIVWSVANRFRLFSDERDFERHVAAAQGRSVLETEQALAHATDGRGWAGDMLNRLCLDKSRIGSMLSNLSGSTALLSGGRNP
jgi:hypothetical protein